MAGTGSSSMTAGEEGLGRGWGIVEMKGREGKIKGKGRQRGKREKEREGK